ncbi:hypothetical protein SERLA73DRAFT_188106 [Serpula lacrymans var. lacrymans S7.3]|uniref:Uncharacterized protein n=2 Tax=Serpula lacrymans var. lacrymans TaxID=341189 RepID=F8QAR5_SERL3|nr:uncharacterized protein SERLADRAFT_478092 [Serpula lacrymans var. lacrymans S7.9]EGN94301.1 hypothetical protein SERLA73DRAFT_188106 [Serpula lacrymans var. lacrymans S7.3]EGO19791.1 hypothetical protein SERLADRAFT_478092 [Serpula lacrymans var. lacrymans S7.9]
MEGLDDASGSSNFDLLASFSSLSKDTEKCSYLEKGQRYRKISLELLYQCQRYSNQSQLDVGEDIDRMENLILRLNAMALRLEQQRKTFVWNPRRLIKMYRTRREFAAQSLEVLKLTKSTSDDILRRRIYSAENREAIINYTASYFTAVDSIIQGDVTSEDEANDDGPDAKFDQNDQQVLTQVQGFHEALQSIPVNQLKASTVIINQDVFIQSVVNQGSSTNSSVIVGGSYNRGGGNQHNNTSSSQPFTVDR